MFQHKEIKLSIWFKTIFILSIKAMKKWYDLIWYFVDRSFSLKVEHPGKILSSRNCKSSICWESLCRFVCHVDVDNFLTIDLQRWFHCRCESGVVDPHHELCRFEEWVLEIYRRTFCCNLVWALRLWWQTVAIQCADILPSIWRWNNELADRFSHCRGFKFDTNHSLNSIEIIRSRHSDSWSFDCEIGLHNRSLSLRINRCTSLP